MPRLLLFGQLRGYAEGLHGAEIETSATSMSDLLNWLGQHHPELSEALARPGVRYAVDGFFADTKTPILPRSEIALMSPLSGG